MSTTGDVHSFYGRRGTTGPIRSRSFVLLEARAEFYATRRSRGQCNTKSGRVRDDFCCLSHLCLTADEAEFVPTLSEGLLLLGKVDVLRAAGADSGHFGGGRGDLQRRERERA